MDRLTRWFGSEVTEAARAAKDVPPPEPNRIVRRCCEYEDTRLSPAGVRELIALCPNGYESILNGDDKGLVIEDIGQ